MPWDQKDNMHKKYLAFGNQYMVADSECPEMGQMKCFKPVLMPSQRDRPQKGNTGCRSEQARKTAHHFVLQGDQTLKTSLKWNEEVIN